MVPVVDLARRGTRYQQAFVARVEQVVSSGHVLLGPELAAFEQSFAGFTGHASCVGVASGATAIQLVLAALGIGPGDEVIVPAFTAVPTASAVCAIGATPVPVDVDEATATIDPAAAVTARTSRTRAVIPVHLYGRPADPCAELGVPVVGDAAQAHGAVRGSARAAAGATVATAYSFYPTKNLGGIGDGGAIVTNDGELDAVLRRMRVHGMSAQYVHTEISQNFRMSELEAAWLSLLLPDLAAANERRRDVAAAYRAAAPDLRWHAPHPDHVYHLAVARVAERDRFRTELAELGVATAVHYPLAITQQPAYRHLTRAACPRAEAWAAECVSVPCFPEITDGEVEHVCAALAKVAGDHR